MKAFDVAYGGARSACLAALVAVLAAPACTQGNDKFCDLETSCGPSAQCNFTAGACESNTLVYGDGRFAQLLEPTTKLDLLLVVENSPGSAVAQARFSQGIRQLAEALPAFGASELHLAAITSDVGISPHQVGSCGADGDDGDFSDQAERCGVSGTFLRTEADGSASNFADTLANTAVCHATPGAEGCEFPQPITAMRLALEPQTGFVRDDAFLAIINLALHDDCSPFNFNVFNPDPGLDNMSSELGPLSEYRCFDHGVICDETVADPAQDRAKTGRRSNCRSNDDGRYMHSVQNHADFLRGLKGPQVWNTSIRTDGTVEVVHIDSLPSLVDICGEDGVSATPAPRLRTLARHFGIPQGTNVCNPKLSDEVGPMAERIEAFMSGRCLAAVPADDAGAPDCVLLDVANQGKGGILDSFGPCRAADAARPCLRFANDDSCPVDGAPSVTIERGEHTAPTNSAPILLCRARE